MTRKDSLDVITLATSVDEMIMLLSCVESSIIECEHWFEKHERDKDHWQYKDIEEDTETMRAVSNRIKKLLTQATDLPSETWEIDREDLIR